MPGSALSRAEQGEIFLNFEQRKTPATEVGGLPVRQAGRKVLGPVALQFAQALKNLFDLGQVS